MGLVLGGIAGRAAVGAAPPQLMVTLTSLEVTPVSVSITRNLLAPLWLVWMYVANVSLLTGPVTGKSDHLPRSRRWTCRIAPSPPG